MSLVKFDQPTEDGRDKAVFVDPKVVTVVLDSTEGNTAIWLGKDRAVVVKGSAVVINARLFPPLKGEK